MKSSLALIAFALAHAPSAVIAAVPAKPNIILIYSDDHGFADLAAQKTDPDIRTPNLDAMARDGVRFLRGYVSAPQCVPSRAGVITGRYQQRFGVEDNTKGPLPLAEITIAERLKPAGYISCQVGKWHLEPPPRGGGEATARGGSTPDERSFLPLGQGFEEYYTGPMNTFVASHDLKGNKLPDAPRTLTDPRFRCVWQTDAALSFINRHARDPFFLYLAYFTPHVPLQSPEPWFSRTPSHLPLERRQALAMIAAMDEGIGQIRARLHELGIDRNTLVFFIGDNGAPLRDGAWNGSLNTPLTGEKGMLTDGGIRTPFLAAWPGTLPAGVVYEPPVINLDVAATAAAIAGLPSDPVLEGVNLIPFVRGEKSGAPHDALFWRWRSQAAVRADHWKLILLGAEEKFLFDLDSPEGENKNRLADFPAVAADLERRLKAWDATLPPPPLPRAINAQDQAFFDSHVLKTAPAPNKRARAAKGATTEGSSSPIQGWAARNGTLALVGGALRLSAPANGRPFITYNGLSLPGPIKAIVRLRTPAGGNLALAWRTKEQPDFAAGNSAQVTVAASADWQTVTLTLPAQGEVIHVRLHLPSAQGVEISRIEFSGSSPGGPRVWDFSAPPKP